MDLYKLKSFAMVARLEGVSRAAEKLFLTQPAVSAHIKDLENEFGTRLFDRIGRSIRLTKAGEALLPYVESILNLYDDSHFAVDLLKEPEHGSISLGTSNLPGARLVPDCLAAFLRCHPHISVSITAKNSQQILRMVKQQKLDLGIIGSSEENLNAPDLNSRTLFKDEVVVAVSPDHPLARRDSIRIEELAGLPVIVSLKNTISRQAIENFFHKFSIPYTVAYEIGDNLSMIKAMVEKNLGIAFFSRLEIEREAGMGWIKMIPVEDVPFFRYFQVICNKKKEFSPTTELFYNFLFSAENPNNFSVQKSR